MQTPPRFLTTQHRRKRLALFALAMLTWIASVLFAGGNVSYRQLKQRHHRMSIDGITRTIIQLLIVRASELTGGRRHKRLRFYRYGRDLKRPHLFRSLLGSKLRRALKHKDLAARIAILIGVLRNLDICARDLAMRMKRGLTRLWAVKPATIPVLAFPEPLAALVCRHLGGGGSPALADSS